MFVRTTGRGVVTRWFRAERLLTADYSVMLNWNVDIEGLTGVIINGEEFLLDGPPMPHWNPMTGSIEYVRIDLRTASV